MLGALCVLLVAARRFKYSHKALGSAAGAEEEEEGGTGCPQDLPRQGSQHSVPCFTNSQLFPCPLQVFSAAGVHKLHRGQLLGECKRGSAAVPFHDHPGARDQHRQGEPGAFG